MSKAAWFHCFAGIAGDMTLGALIDAGADIDDVRATVGALNVDGWTIEAEVTQRNGIRATHVDVDVDEDHQHARPWRVIREILQTAELPERVKQRSLAIFRTLAEVEAMMHSTDIENVHFHEVGGIDAIVDIVGSCAALESLGIDHIYSSAIANGSGTIRSAHGIIPNPAPAVVALLRTKPTYGLDQSLELTTPTGAAIITTLAEDFGTMPSFDPLLSSGFGAGTRELDGIPNCVQVLVGELADSEFRAHDTQGQPVVLLEVNVDDATGETIAHTVSQLLDQGAHDAWITPIVMKKGRPAYTISALADVSKADEIAHTLVNETGSFGVRGQTMQRWPMRRTFETVDLEQPVGVKVGPHRTKAEFDDARTVAAAKDRPVREVIAEAEAKSKT